MTMDKGTLADTIAIPFWVILIIYSIFEIKKGNSGAWLVLIIISAALIVDSCLVLQYLKNKNR
jgi:hypothetical protein